MQFGGNRRFNSRGGSSGGGFAPVRVGEEIDVTIEAVGEKGDGVAKVKGFVIFVPGVQQGDNVKVRITKVFRKMAFAEVVGEGSAPAEEPAEGEMPEEEQEEPAEEEEPVQDGEEDSEEF